MPHNLIEGLSRDVSFLLTLVIDDRSCCSALLLAALVLDTCGAIFLVWLRSILLRILCFRASSLLCLCTECMGVDVSFGKKSSSIPDVHSISVLKTDWILWRHSRSSRKELMNNVCLSELDGFSTSLLAVETILGTTTKIEIKIAQLKHLAVNIYYHLYTFL